MKNYLIEFYKSDTREKIFTERVVVKDYEEALRYAKAMKRVHGWTIREIKRLKVREAICHDLRR